MFNPKKYFSAYLNTKKLHAVPIDRAGEKTKIYFKNGNSKTDITHSHALVSLKPFAIAINAGTADFDDGDTCILQICDDERLLGELILKYRFTNIFSTVSIILFEACIPRDSNIKVNQVWTRWMLLIKNATDKRSKYFIVPPKELMKLFVYTLKPRPVFLISVEHMNGFDAFPIDLFGKISEDQVVFSVRSSSAAIPFIFQERKICACSVSFDNRSEVYKFGGHHPGGVLPEHLKVIHFTKSEKLQLPVPSFANNVLELVLEDSFVTGAHTQFIARVIHWYYLSDKAELAHTPWFNTNHFIKR